MKTIKVSELTRAALDWAVAKCEGDYLAGYAIDWRNNRANKYSTNWAKGGPIIERERLCVDIDSAGVWLSCIKQNYADDSHHMHSGSTPLEAAMRCYVASKLGDTVDIPKELTT